MQKFSRNNSINVFSHDLKEAYRMKSGETVIVETNDCFSQEVRDEKQKVEEIDQSLLNPATGPIFIEGAEVGDLLKVEILDIAIEDKGVATTTPGEGALKEESEEAIVRVIEVNNGYAHYLGKEIPINPMIGVIGVAPDEKDGNWGTHSPWKHGGNMDTKLITKDTTLYFRVNQEGAMLALGDCHAVMGDGELNFTGVEIPAEVTLKVTALKNKREITWPVLETEDRTVIIGSGETMEKALQASVSEAVKYISEVMEISWPEAYIMAGQTVDARISQVVNPRYTIRAEIPQYIIKTEEILEKNE